VLNHQIPVHRIYAMSMGNAPAAGADGTMAKRNSGRRVEINLMKNDLVVQYSTENSAALQVET